MSDIPVSSPSPKTTSQKSSTKRSELLSKGRLLVWVSSGLLGLALLVAAWTVYSVPWSEPRDIRVTNVVDRSATVTWVTDEATAGAVIYGEDDYFMPWLFAGYGKYVAYEDRDIVEARLEAASARSEALDDIEGAEVSFEEISEQIEINELGSYYVHHVTLVGLEPEKTYYFMVGNGRRFEISSEQFASDYTITEEYSFTTYKELDDMVTPNPSYGTVLSTGGAVDDGVIFMTIDGLPGSPVSAALNDEGAWYIDLANMRTMDGERLTGWDELTSSELMFVEAGVFGESEQITNPMSVDAPADPIPVLVEEASSSSNGGNRLVSFVQAITVVDGDQSVECNNRGGTCMDKSGCEDWVTGLCPGGSDWICCTKEKTESPTDYVSCPSGQSCSTSYKCSEQEGGTPGSEECAEGKYCCDRSGSASGSETDTDPCPSGFHETDYTSWSQCSPSVIGEDGAYCCKDSASSGDDDDDSTSTTYDDSMCDAIGGTCKNPSSCTGSNNKVYYGLCGGGADRRCCAPVAVQEDSNPTESGCGEVRCGPDASSCWNSGKDGGRNPSCNWAKCNESGKWEAVSNCCGSCAQPSSGGSGGSQSGKCCSINDEEYTWSTSGSCGGYPVETGVTTEYACETLNTVGSEGKCCSYNYGGESYRYWSDTGTCVAGNPVTDVITEGACDTTSTSGGGVCCNTSEGQEWFPGIDSCVDGQKVDLTEEGCGAKVYDSSLCSKLTDIGSCSLAPLVKEACEWITCATGTSKCQPRGTSVDSVCGNPTQTPTEIALEENNCSAPIVGARCGQCGVREWTMTTSSDGLTVVCTDEGDGINARWKVMLSDKETKCPKEPDCYCEGSNTAVEVGRSCQEGNASNKVGMYKLVNPGEKCTTPGTEGECYCKIPMADNYMKKGEYCRQTTSCSWDKKGQVCNVNGNTCEDGDDGLYYCTGDAPSSQLPQEDKNGVAYSVTLNPGVLGDTEVQAQESSNAIVLSPSQGLYAFEKEGVYCTDYQDEPYCFNVSAPGEISLYIDTDGSGTFNEGDIDVGAESVELSLSLEEATYSTAIRAGYNFISFDLVVPDVDMASEVLDALNAEHDGVVYSIAKFESGRWVVIENRDGKTFGSDDFQIIPGRGYVLKSAADFVFHMTGKTVVDPVPVSLIEGWNLIGVHGTQTAYTASSLIDGIDGVEGLDADNVTEWSTEKSKYEGLQKEQDAGGNEEVYGFDFPIDNKIGYFVRIASGSGTWTPAE